MLTDGPISSVEDNRWPKRKVTFLPRGQQKFSLLQGDGQTGGRVGGICSKFAKAGYCFSKKNFKLEPLNALPHTIDINSQQSDKSTRPLPFVNLQWLQHCYSSNNYGDSSYFGRLAPDGCESFHGPMDRTSWERSYSGLSAWTSSR